MSYLSLLDINIFAILVCFALASLIVIGHRLIMQYKAKKALESEIAKRDNFAFGINYACQISIIAITGAYIFPDVYKHLTTGHFTLAILTVLISFSFILLGQYIHRKWILNRFNEEKAIMKQNICAALVDSGMLLGNTILVLGIFHRLHPQGFSDLLVATMSFIVLQLAFAIDSKLRELRFAKANQGASLQQNFNLANTSIGIRYAGKTVGLSLALFAGLQSAPYHGATIVENINSVLLHCGIMWVLLYSMSFSLIHFALPRVNIGLEVDHQDNIGVACIEFAVFTAMGYLLINIFSV